MHPVPVNVLFELLDSVEDRCHHKVRLRCSKCNRTLDEFMGLPGTGNLESDKPHVLPLPVDTSLPGEKTPRPGVKKVLTMSSTEWVHERFTYFCHRRCGRSYTVRMDTLVVAYVKAVRAGVSDLPLPIGT